MTHPDLLHTFLNRSHEQEIHQQILENPDYVVPVEELKSYMIALTQIPMLEFFMYLDARQEAAAFGTSDITQCGTLSACTDELCQVLQEAAREGMTVQEIGRAEVYAKYLRVHHQASWTRMGNHQAKTAQQLGLACKEKRRWHLSCYGYAYAFPLLSKLQQKRFLARALLRNAFYAQVLSKVRFEEIKLGDYMKGLSASTQGARANSVVKLLQIGLDEMDREGIKRHDIYVPKYHAARKELTEKLLPGTFTALDTYGLAEDYFTGGVPLYTVKAACGYFVDHEVPELEGWMDLQGNGVKTNSEDYFVVYAKGDSMLPKIKDGDLCLFKWYKGEPLYDDIVLTQCRDYDEEYESSYTIKCFHPNVPEEGEPQTISLEPLNKAKYHPIVLSAEDGCDYKTIGKFVKVLEA